MRPNFNYRQYMPWFLVRTSPRTPTHNPHSRPHPPGTLFSRRGDITTGTTRRTCRDCSESRYRRSTRRPSRTCPRFTLRHHTHTDGKLGDTMPGDDHHTALTNNAQQWPGLGSTTSSAASCSSVKSQGAPILRLNIKLGRILKPSSS